MNFSAYSIKNPLVATLLFTLLTIVGIFAFSKMKVQNLPDVDFPGVVVTVTMAGAAPAQLENDVAKKVENKLANIEGVKHLRTTLQTGAATVFVEFELEKPLQEAVDDVRSAVSEVQGDLPAAANEPIIAKVSTAGFPMVTYSIASDKMNDQQLSWFVSDTLSKQLTNIEGVGKIEKIGGIERQITITPKPDLLNSLQMPISQLSQQIHALWQDASGGESKIGNQTQTIRVLGAGEQISDLGQLQITTPAGSLQLNNLADVNDTHADRTSIATLDGEPVVAFSITRSRGAGEVEVVQAVDDELLALTQAHPDIKIQKIVDYVTPIKEDYQASIQMLIEGCVLAVIVVFVFLKDWRATFVAAAALPLSIIPTFLVMYLFGFTLNIISLLALSLVIGVLVDDAIVEIENIMRHLQMGKTPYEAAMEAADEIGLAVVATTFTLIAVFLPTAFMSGVIGQFFQQFGWTAAIAVFISLLVARLVTPMMAAYILKPTKHKTHKAGKAMTWYLSVVKWTLKHRFITVASSLVFFVGSVSLASLLPTAFIPPDDANQTQVSLEMTPDATIDDTMRIADLASDAIKTVDGVQSVLIAVGQAASTGDPNRSGGGTVNTATLDVKLAERGERAFKADIEKQISQALIQVPAARFTVNAGGAGGETGYSFSLTSANAKQLDEVVGQVMNEIRQLPQVASVSSNKALPKPELTITPDHLAMADKGVTTHQIADTVRIATTGDYDQLLPKINLDTRQLPIIIRLPDDAKADINELNQLYVPSSKGESVRLSDVARLDFGVGEAQVGRLDRQRAIKITVNPAFGEVGELIEAVKQTDALNSLPAGMTVIDEGQAQNMTELFGGFVMAMGVGVFCIFAVLVLLFHRILQPFTILMALPLSIGGALLGLILTGSSLSMPSMIGFIMLMGIATKNSILLVDYAIIAQDEHGLSRFDALMDACHKRAQPIVMTTIAMGAGMLPLLLGLGGADPTFRQPMAAAVIGGLVTSTLLSLVVVPVVYTLMDDVSAWFGGKKAKANQPS